MVLVLSLLYIYLFVYILYTPTTAPKNVMFIIELTQKNTKMSKRRGYKINVSGRSNIVFPLQWIISGHCLGKRGPFSRPHLYKPRCYLLQGTKGHVIKLLLPSLLSCSLISECTAVKDHLLYYPWLSRASPNEGTTKLVIGIQRELGKLPRSLPMPPFSSLPQGAVLP